MNDWRNIKSSLKILPSVERVLEDERVSETINVNSRNGITRITRDTIEYYRNLVLSGEDLGDEAGILSRIRDEVARKVELTGRTSQRKVINATGVVLHTNLGRAPLGDCVTESLLRAASGYIDLEVDLETGERTHRERRVIELLELITGAESALVVNNTAAALLLAVNTFAGEGTVAVSRGELVEIGGSFRLPEILERSAARVLEIGTTNRTDLKDYERAVEDGASLILKVHTSNYRIVGYTDDVPLGRLAELGKAKDVPVMYDQGSGILFPLGKEGISGEADIGSLLSTGVDIMTFSGDKVLGGPQAGIIIGRRRYIEQMKKNHLSRALRVDKLTLACLEAVLVRYWRGETAMIPALHMIMTTRDEIAERAESFSAALRERTGETVEIEVVEGESSIGGGSFPLDPLPTALVEIRIGKSRASRLAGSMRGMDPAVFVRIKEESLYLDMRTVAEDEEQILLDSLEEGINRFSGKE
ncbi:MAG: L-seryl-tRNA(Sec) selenium transferase [Candidatus Krumholzibacteria bacterium]|nr:L-seryl-tRNA(Sec) selenium transferase [Candidatus Krumholzibacteria bacterium]